MYVMKNYFLVERRVRVSGRAESQWRSGKSVGEGGVSLERGLSREIN